MEELVHGFFQHVVAEYGGNEFTAAVRFVAGREAAGEHDNLGMADALCHFFYRCLQFCRVPISKDENIGNGTGPFKGSGTVHFAVVAGHGGDEDPGPGQVGVHVELRNSRHFRKKGSRLFDAGRPSRENGIQRFFIGRKEVGEGNGFSVGFHGLSAHSTQNFGMRFFSKALRFFRRGFYNDGTVEVAEEFGKRQIFRKADAQAVAEGHLGRRHSHAAVVHSLHGSHMARFHFLIEEVGVFLEYIKVRHAFLVLGHTEEDQHVPFLLQFLAHCFRCFAGSNGKGYQRRRYVDIIEGTAHGILAADGTKTQGFLHMEGSQKSCCRLAPACFICQFFEIFLQCKVSLSPVSPHGHQAGDGKKDRIYSPVERTPGGQIRVKPVGHEAGAVSFSLSHRELGCHAVGRRLLVLSAERHEHRAGADGGVEPFRQSLLGAVVQIPHGGNPGILYGRNGFGMEIPFVIGLCNMGSLDLLGAVGIQKGSGNIDDRHPSPLHHQPVRIGHIGDDCGFQIFFCCIADKLVRIFLLHHHCHPFLGFRNSQFRAVKAFIFLRHLVQVDIQSVSEFPHCHRYAAGTEIIAPLNETGHLAPAEEALNLSFRQRIALLYFCTAGFNGFRIQFLGRTGGAAHAVTAGPSAYQNHHISRLGRQADHMVRRSCGHHRTDFHTLCNKSGMVVFLHFPCSQTNLVAIGAVPFGCFNGNLPLGELARQRLGKRRPGVAGTGNAHGLVYIGTAG